MTNNLTVKIAQMEAAKNLPLPDYKTIGASGMDIAAAIMEPMTLKPLGRAAVPTGLKIAIPHGYEAQIRSRSGLALKDGIAVLNAPGTIDCDYRGEIKVVLINLSDKDFEITHGMRIAQMVFAPVTRSSFEVALELDTTQRGEGGFGSTGTGKNNSHE